MNGTIPNLKNIPTNIKATLTTIILLSDPFSINAGIKIEISVKFVVPKQPYSNEIPNKKINPVKTPKIK
jgi:hypothetical protein